MRKQVTTLVFILLLGVVWAAPALAQDTIGIVTADRLNIRAVPSAAGSSPILAVLPQGSQLLIVGRNADTSFYEVITGSGQRGWAASRYIAVSAGAGRGQPVTSGERTQTVVVADGIVNVPSLNLRTAPDPLADVIAVLPGGLITSIIGRNSDASWYEVVTPEGLLGWVYGEYMIVRNGFAADAPVQNSDQIASLPAAEGLVFNAARVNIRANPDAQAAILGVVVAGETVTILQQSSGGFWYLVRTPSGLRGWIDSDFVRVGIGALGDEDTVSPAVSGGVGGGTEINGLVSQPLLSVRVGPGPRFDRIGAIGFQTRVTVVGRNSDTSWIQIVADDVAGWVYAPYVDQNVGLFTNAPVTG